MHWTIILVAVLVNWSGKDGKHMDSFESADAACAFAKDKPAAEIWKQERTEPCFSTTLTSVTLVTSNSGGSSVGSYGTPSTCGINTYAAKCVYVDEKKHEVVDAAHWELH